MFLVRREDGISWDLQGFTFMRPVNRCEGGQCMCGAWGGAVPLLPLSPALGVKTVSMEHSSFIPVCGASDLWG